MIERDIVVVHGALGSASQMQSVAESLRELGEVRVVELPGHGNTPVEPMLGFDFDGFAGAIGSDITTARQLRELSGYTSRLPPLVFGYSMGGYAALHLATCAPGLLGGIVTFGTKFIWTPEVAARENARLDARTIQEKVPKFAQLLYERHDLKGGWTGVLERTRTLLTSLGNGAHNLREPLAWLDLPVTIAVGERDDTVSADEAREVAGWMKNGTPVVLPGVPHPIEKVPVDEIVTLVRECIAQANAPHRA